MKMFIIFFAIHNSMAADSKKLAPAPISEVWRVGSLYYPLIKDEKTRILTTSKCLKDKNKCEAFQAVLKKDQVKLTEADRAGGKNPGAVACKKIYGGEILILRNSADNEAAFCKFKDNSIASASDLF
jgi:hypothetical protein